MSSPATATERFKALLANALERVCVLEEQLELAQARIAELAAERGTMPPSPSVATFEGLAHRHVTPPEPPTA